MQLEHEGTGVLFREWDVDPLLKSDKVLIVYSEHRRTKTTI